MSNFGIGTGGSHAHGDQYSTVVAFSSVFLYNLFSTLISPKIAGTVPDRLLGVPVECGVRVLPSARNDSEGGRG